MKVKELLEKMSGCSSYGVYTKDGDLLENQTDSKTIIPFLNKNIETFRVWIYDDKDTRKIRCCIYLKD